MSAFFAAIGTIFGTIVFALGDYRILIPALACFFISVLGFTTLSHRRKELLSALLFFLLVFFNYNLRAEHLQYFDIEKYLRENQDRIYLQITDYLGDNAFFQSEFILDIKEKNPDLKSKIREMFLPYRILAKAKSSKGLEMGDIVGFDKPIYKIKDLSYYKAKVLKKNKVYQELGTKHLVFVDHKSSWIGDLQKQIQQYFIKNLSPINSAIITSLLLGSRVSSMPEDFTQNIRNLGLGHFFSASGFNLVILSVFLTWICNICRAPVILSTPLILVAVFVYTGLAGFSPSIIRAAIFVSVYLLSKFINRKIDGKRFIILLAGLILLIDPYAIFDIGFQLSYLATLALLIWAQPVKEYFVNLIRPKHMMVNYVLDVICVSLSVQILVAPLVIYYFNSLQVWTLLANLIFTPLLSLLLVMSFLGLTPLIGPMLDALRMTVDKSPMLPFIEARTEIGFSTFILLLVIFNLSAYLIFIKQAPLEKTRVLALDELVLQTFNNLINNSYTSASIVFSALCFLLAINLPAIGTSTLNIKNGIIINNKEVHDFFIPDKSLPNKTTGVQKNKSKDQALIKEPNYLYSKIKGSEITILSIRKRDSLKTLASLLQDLHEVNILLLPNLNASDIYFDTLLKICKPQFIICSVKRKSPKAISNLETMGSHANTIVNSGRLYISKNKFWSISNN